jgi:poly [ADP-ribose] polymerase
MTDTGKYCKLIMVTAENNNKYYEMKEVNGQLEVTYGRVELTAVKKTYSMYKWDSLIASKEKKGYKNVTHLVSTEVDDDPTLKAVVIPKDDGISGIEDKLVRDFITRMTGYTNTLVKKTYSVKADKVSKVQVDEAQVIIDKLVKLDPAKNKKKVNDLLLELYMTIPRYMSHTTSHLLPAIAKRYNETLVQEQDNLDAMASQVHMLAKAKAKAKKAADAAKKKTTKKKAPTKKTILDTMGVTMVEGKSNKEIKYLTDQVKKLDRYSRAKIKGILTIDKPAENVLFDGWMAKQKDKSTRFLIHGTRCTSVIPIIETGLQIRPAGNFQFSGKAYGDGNYFSEIVKKSLGYTGYDTDKVLLVYEVHTGKPYVYSGWYRGNSFNLNYKELSKRGFDSTHVAAGNGLLNSEIIAYKEQQCTLRHIIWLT